MAFNFDEALQAVKSDEALKDASPEDLLAEVAKLRKIAADARSFVGQQSTEIGTLRKTVDELKATPPKQGTPDSQGSEAGKTAPAKETPRAASPPTESEKQALDQKWNSLPEATRLDLFRSAPGNTPEEKSAALAQTFLEEYRTANPASAIPTTLFGAPAPAGPGAAGDKGQDIRDKIRRLVSTRIGPTMPPQTFVPGQLGVPGIPAIAGYPSSDGPHTFKGDVLSELRGPQA